MFDLVNLEKADFVVVWPGRLRIVCSDATYHRGKMVSIDLVQR